MRLSKRSEEIYDPSTILVVWAETSSAKALKALINSLFPFAGVAETHDDKRMLVVRVPDGYSPHRMVLALNSREEVEHAEVNLAGHLLSYTPTDPDYSVRQSVFEALHLPEAWELTTGSSNVHLVIADTGIDEAHPDLCANYAGGVTIIDGTGVQPHTMVDLDGHGTGTSGTATARMNNNTGACGAAPSVSLHMIRVFGASGFTSTKDLIDAVDWTVALKQSVNAPVVLSMSIGFSVSSKLLADAFVRAHAAGIVCFAAAGNTSIDRYYREFAEFGNSEEPPDLGLYTSMSKVVFDRDVGFLLGDNIAVQYVSNSGWELLGQVHSKAVIGGKIYANIGYFPNAVLVSKVNDLLSGQSKFCFNLGLDDQGNLQGVPGATVTYGTDVLIESVTWEQDAYSFPASYDHVISVGATGRLVGARPADGVDFSNNSADYSGKAEFSTANDMVDLCAPGSFVFAPVPTTGTASDWMDRNQVYHSAAEYDPTDPYGLENGTSFSSPLAAAGGAALALSVCPTLSPDDVETILKITATTGITNVAGTAPHPLMGAGQVNARAAVLMAQAVANGVPVALMAQAVAEDSFTLAFVGVAGATTYRVYRNSQRYTQGGDSEWAGTDIAIAEASSGDSWAVSAVVGGVEGAQSVALEVSLGPKRMPHLRPGGAGKWKKGGAGKLRRG